MGTLLEHEYPWIMAKNRKQKEAEDAVKALLEENGYQPTYQEVADRLKLSKTAVYNRLRGSSVKMRTFK
ncbi:hypothetical protein EHO57_13755 [Leptospira langatensis]|uniref:HTH domain-containing protein n=1 Tax=Leptospira langatensis TaxID=2484983 RepID=A0A5R2AT28_9LEPT|nr:hypothetical protein [Leptospira langatensis]TGJ99824.1 hypothetical protein EHO57_13755 [Leptospira langatensis]